MNRYLALGKRGLLSELLLHFPDLLIQVIVANVGELHIIDVPKYRALVAINDLV